MGKIKLGKNIRFLREQNNLDQQELAKILNIPRPTLSCWETGKRTPKLEQIIKIANYFNVSLDFISKDLSEAGSSLNNKERNKK